MHEENARGKLPVTGVYLTVMGNMDETLRLISGRLSELDDSGIQDMNKVPLSLRPYGDRSSFGIEYRFVTS